MMLLDLVDKISAFIENNEYTIGIFLDLAKAFDTVNHDILLSKFHYGICGFAYDWFKSYQYLANRVQYVSLIINLMLPHNCIQADCSIVI